MADRKHSGPDISDTENEPCHKRPKSSQAETRPEEEASEGAMCLEGEFALLETHDDVFICARDDQKTAVRPHAPAPSVLRALRLDLQAWPCLYDSRRACSAIQQARACCASSRTPAPATHTVAFAARCVRRRDLRLPLLPCMPADLGALASAGALDGAEACEEALTSEHLLNLVFSHLCLEDLCRAAMVRRRWRDVTANPEFWRTINLRGRTLMVSKVGAARGPPAAATAGARAAAVAPQHQPRVTENHPLPLAYPAVPRRPLRLC